MLDMAKQNCTFRGGDGAFAQVGWLGQSGEVYPLDGAPHESERGGFAPLYLQVGQYVTDAGGRSRLED